MQDIIKEKLHISWKLLAIIVLTIILGSIIGYTGFVLHKGKYSLPDQLGYYRYDTSGEFGQFSVFMPSSASFVKESVDYTRYSLVSNLRDNGYEEDMFICSSGFGGSASTSTRNKGYGRCLYGRAVGH